MFYKNGSGGFYCLYFHTWLSTAKLAGLQGNVIPSGNCSNCRKFKIPDNVFMIQTPTLSPSNTLVSDVSEVCGLGTTGMVSHWKAQALPAAVGAAPCVSMSLHQCVLWAARSVGLKLTCTSISVPICQRGRGGVGSEFSGTRGVSKKPCQLHGAVWSRSTGLYAKTIHFRSSHRDGGEWGGK